MTTSLEFVPIVRKVKGVFIAEIPEMNIMGKGMTRSLAEQDLLKKTERILQAAFAEQDQLT